MTMYNPATQRQETYFIGEQSEISLGNRISSTIIKENKMIENTELNLLVENIGKKIVAVSDRKNLKYHFYVVDDSSLNAFAVPGGHIFVNKGLIENTNKDELSFVIAHEIGHIAARHSIKKMQAAMGVNILLSIALKDVSSGLVNSAVDIVYNVVSSGFSRSDEFLADSLAVKYTKKAGVNPYAGVSLMEKMKKQATGHPFVYLSSHPDADQRIKNIENKITERML